MTTEDHLFCLIFFKGSFSSLCTLEHHYSVKTWQKNTLKISRQWESVGMFYFLSYAKLSSLVLGWAHLSIYLPWYSESLLSSSSIQKDCQALPACPLSPGRKLRHSRGSPHSPPFSQETLRCHCAMSGYFHFIDFVWFSWCEERWLIWSLQGKARSFPFT